MLKNYFLRGMFDKKGKIKIETIDNKTTIIQGFNKKNHAFPYQQAVKI